MSAFRQLLLNFVTERAFDDLFARAGRQFLIARWSSESLVRGDEDSYRHFASQADLPQRVIAADKRPPSLTPYNTNRVRLQLMLREPLLARLESIILRLLHVFDEDASRMRATVMKAISELVQADPAVMVIPVSVSLWRLTSLSPSNSAPVRWYLQQVARVIAGRMHDPSRLVRAEALDMLGRNIQAVPRLLDSYFDLLLGMIVDEGVNVRKVIVVKDRIVNIVAG